MDRTAGAEISARDEMIVKQRIYLLMMKLVELADNLEVNNGRNDF